MIVLLGTFELVQLEVLLKRTGYKSVSIEKLKNQKRFFHVFDQLVFVFVLVQLGLENYLVGRWAEFVLHAFYSTKKFEIVYEVLLDLINFFCSLLEKWIGFEMVQKEIHDQNVELTDIYVNTQCYSEIVRVLWCRISRSWKCWLFECYAPC